MATWHNVSPGRGNALVMRVTASRARRDRADIFCRFTGSRPIAASMRRPACTTPQTSATYSFAHSRSRGHFLPVHRIPPDRGLDASAGLHDAPDKCDVLLLHFAIVKLARQLLM